MKDTQNNQEKALQKNKSNLEGNAVIYVNKQFNCKNQWKKIIKFDKKIPNGILTILSFIISAIAIFIAIHFYYHPQIPEIYVSEAIVGVAPFQVNDKNNLEDRYLGLLKSANKYLRNHHSKHRLAVDISERGGYEGVIDDLRDGNIKMAFISTYSYCIKMDSVQTDNNKIKDIGFLRKQNQGVYSYGIVCKKGGSLDNYLKDKKIDSKNSVFINILRQYVEKDSIILCNEELSTSTHVLPEIFLSKIGFNMRSKKKHGEMTRAMIKDSLRIKDFIAFFSNEDYERINDNNNIKFYKIDFPKIPYDAILVNSEWWESLKKDTTEIKNALKNLPIGFENKNEHSIKERELFKMYVCSGIIWNDSIRDSIYVTLPDPRFNKDVYNFRPNDTVDIVSFIEWNINTKMYSTLDTIHRGNGILRKNGDNYYLDSIKGSSEKGYHILPNFKD